MSKASTTKARPPAPKRASSALELSKPDDAQGLGKRCSVNLELDGFKKRLASGRCHFDEKTGKVSANVDVSGGKSLKLGGKSFSFSGSKVGFELDLDPLLAEVESHKLDPKVAMELQDEDGVWKGELHFGSDMAKERLGEVSKGPLLFPGEDASTAAGRHESLLLLGYMSKTAGKKVPLKELDLIAESKSSSRTLGFCRYRTPSGQVRSVKRVRFDKVVTVYERRTGRRLGTKVIKASNPSCPSRVKVGKSLISKHASSSAVLSFARKFVK